MPGYPHLWRAEAASEFSGRTTKDPRRCNLDLIQSHLSRATVCSSRAIQRRTQGQRRVTVRLRAALLWPDEEVESLAPRSFPPAQFFEVKLRSLSSRDADTDNYESNKFPRTRSNAIKFQPYYSRNRQSRYP